MPKRKQEGMPEKVVVSTESRSSQRNYNQVRHFIACYVTKEMRHKIWGGWGKRNVF